MPHSQINWKHLLISIFFCQIIGALGSAFTSPAIPTWYATLAKPSFLPPSWAFPVVWTLLYLLMGTALYLVWEEGLEKADVRKAMGVFGIQLFLNFMWSVLFFGLRSPPIWTCRHSCSMDSDTCEHLDVLQSLKKSRITACAIHPMGIICSGAELLDMGAQRVKNRNQIPVFHLPF